MLTFCTHFNIRYLSKAIALHESMEKHIKDYHLFMFVFDDLSLSILNKLKLSNTTLVSYKEFENEALLEIKRKRNVKEYMWTVTAFTISYILKTYPVENCTYIDADIYFFHDPSQVFEEQKNYSAIITEHRYHAKYDQTSTSGRFCVQFNTFTNSAYSLNILKEWQELVAEWCYDRQEDGLFGDQMYLDQWPEKYADVHIAMHPGIGVAPWNILSYAGLSQTNGSILLNSNIGQSDYLIFYHFHGLSLYSGKIGDLGNFILKQNVVKLIYKPYLNSIKKANRKIQENSNAQGLFTPFNWSIKNILRQGIRLKRNIFHIVRY